MLILICEDLLPFAYMCLSPWILATYLNIKASTFPSAGQITRICNSRMSVLTKCPSEMLDHSIRLRLAVPDCSTVEAAGLSINLVKMITRTHVEVSRLSAGPLKVSIMDACPIYDGLDHARIIASTRAISGNLTAVECCSFGSMFVGPALVGRGPQDEQLIPERQPQILWRVDLHLLGVSVDNTKDDPVWEVSWQLAEHLACKVTGQRPCSVCAALTIWNLLGPSMAMRLQDAAAPSFSNLKQHPNIEDYAALPQNIVRFPDGTRILCFLHSWL